MISWIDNSTDFAEFCRSLPPGQPIAIDTEFDWQHSYHPLFALLQIAVDWDSAALIDPFTIDDWEPLRDLLTDASRRKLFFSGSNDLPILVRACGGPDKCLPVNIFDVQEAYLFLGKQQPTALKTIVFEEMNITLNKSETRSDWTIRPLTDRQLDYAAEDVVLLPELALKTEERLKENGNLDFFLEEMEKYSNPEIYLDFPCEEAHLHISRYRYVESASQRSRLRGLAVWRERLAREENISRNRIFNDEQLCWIAARVPSIPAKLYGMPKYRHSSISKYGEAAIAAMKEHIPENEPPERTVWTPELKSAVNELTERILKLIQKRAAERTIAPTYIAARKEAEKLALRIIHKKPTDNLQMLSGWRRKVLDPAISEIIGK